MTKIFFIWNSKYQAPYVTVSEVYNSLKYDELLLPLKLVYS